MQLVHGYSSEVDSDLEIHPTGLQKKTSIKLSHFDHKELENKSSTISTDKKLETISMNHDIFLKLSSGNKKRSYFSKSELKSKKRNRKGQGPWSRWDTSSEDEILNDPTDTTNFPQFNDETTNDNVRSVESSNFYGKSLVDYQGRGILHPPSDVNIDFTKEPLSFQCYLPKNMIHLYSGHENGVTRLRFLPKSGHLFLSSGHDQTIKIWDLYHERSLLRDYNGHLKSISDINFTADGSNFVSVSYDQSLKVWDTETGSIKYKNLFKSIPNCSTFHPINGNEMLVGLSNSEIHHFDLRESYKNGLIQTYDHHLASVIALKYFPNGSKFVSSSEDKTVRIWENQINIPIKQISDTTQHSMPWIETHPEKNYFSTQSLDNTIYTYSMKPKYKKHPKKMFQGHNSVGYSISFGFSPDGRYISSGDSKGYIFIWDWKTTRLLKKLDPPDGKPITSIVWSPQETSKMICSGNDGKIYLFD